VQRGRAATSHRTRSRLGRELEGSGAYIADFAPEDAQKRARTDGRSVLELWYSSEPALIRVGRARASPRSQCSRHAAHRLRSALPHSRGTCREFARTSERDATLSLSLSMKPHGDPLEEFRFPFGRTGIDRRRDVSR
jgi:hypothetical protein